MMNRSIIVLSLSLGSASAFALPVFSPSPGLTTKRGGVTVLEDGIAAKRLLLNPTDRHLVKELVLEGNAATVGFQSVGLRSVAIRHPRGPQAFGRIEILFEASQIVPGPAKAIVSSPFEATIRLDSRDQVNPRGSAYVLGPKFPAKYEVVLGGKVIGVLNYTINGIATLEEVPEGVLRE